MEGRPDQFVAAMVGLASVNNPFSSDGRFAQQLSDCPMCPREDDKWPFIGNCVRGRVTKVMRISRVFPEAEELKTALIRLGTTQADHLAV